MSKGSGGTKGAANGHSANSKSLTFKETMNGQWDMDVPGVGGGQILQADVFGGGKKYEAYAWDGDYNMLNGGAKKEFATLNAAKDYIKNAVAPKSAAVVSNDLKKKIKKMGDFNNWKGYIGLYLKSSELKELKKAGIDYQNMSMKDIYKALK